MSYTPLAIAIVMNGRTAPMRGSAGVLENVQSVGEDAAVAGAADGDLLALPAAVPEGDHALGPALHPPHGPPQVPRHPGHHRVLGVEGALRAEPAAHVRDDDPHFRRVDPEPGGDGLARRMRPLRARPHREPTVDVGCGCGRPDLQRAGGDALVPDGLGDDDVALIEGHRLPRIELHRHVRPGVGEQEHLVPEGVLHGDDGREWVVIDGDELGRVLPLVSLLGDHYGHCLAHVPHHAGGEGRHAHRVVDHGERRRRRRQREVVVREDTDHTRRRECIGGVDRDDASVGHGRAHEGQMQRAGQRRLAHRDVVHVLAAHGQQRGVLLADDPIAQDARAHAPL